MLKINIKLTLEQLRGLKLLGINVQDAIDKYERVEVSPGNYIANTSRVLGNCNDPIEVKHLRMLQKSTEKVLENEEVIEVYLYRSARLRNFKQIASGINMLMSDDLKHMRYRKSYAESLNNCLDSFRGDVNLNFGKGE